MAILPPHALALPQGGDVVAGSVSSDVTGNTLTLTQTGNAAIMNWTDFGIGAGETVTINQAVNAALLNRVTGANASELLGQLSATGRVFLINPNGVVVGADSTINAQEFIASTQNVSNAAFLDFASGNSSSLLFEGTSTAGVSNAGAIVASDGDVILVGYRVANSGTITAAKGVAGLAAGQKVWFKPQNAQHLIIESSVSAPDADAADGTGVANSGNISAIQAELKAAAANVYALAINQTGVVAATGVENRNGRILLTSEQGTVAHTAGSLTARNADGSGGEVLVGGDYYGLDPNSDDNGVHLAASTTIGAGATINVSASAADADGGRAVVWSGGNFSRTGSTTFAGTINAQGGASGGDGGYAVVAGHQALNLSGSVDVSAAAGEDGTLVLGLPNVTIADTATNDTANNILSNTALATQLASANVVIDAFGSWIDEDPTDFFDGDPGSIRVTGDVAWTSTNGLTLKSGHTVRMTADLNAPNAPIELQVMGVDTRSQPQSVYLDYGAAITADRLTVGQNADSAFIGFNPPPQASRHIGALNFQGIVKVGTLDLKLENGGIGRPNVPFDGEIDDAISMFRAENEIGTLTSSVTGAAINGNLNIVDSSGDLTVSGDFSRMKAGATTSITTAGSLTLDGLAKFGASALTVAGVGGEPDTVVKGQVALAAQGGSFINNSSAGAATVTVDANSRFLIYSDHPDDTVTGGLTAGRYYGASYDNFAPRDLAAGQGSTFFYSFQPTLTFSASAARTYGDANPTLEYTVTGLLAGDLLADAFSGTPTLSTAATASANAGEHTITVEQGTVVQGSYGYALAFTPGTLTVNPAVLNFTADNASRLYGAADPTFTGTLTGFKLGENASVLTTAPTFTTTATVASGVGEYTLNAAGAAATNYTFTYVPGTLTINPAPLTLTPAAASREYGDANPTFAASFNGLVNGDTAAVVSGTSFATTATAISDVGSYAITASGASAANYTLSYEPGTLSVTPAPVTVTADAASRLYGASNPAFSGTVSGLKLNQSASVLTNLAYSTPATTTSDVGAYAITPGGATNPNYSYTYEAGSLTVNPAPLTIKANDAGASFNQPLPTFTASYTGLVAGDTSADIAGLVLSTTASQGSPVGTYTITAAGATNANYTISFEPGIFTISSRILNITADDFTRLYGQANPTFTATVTGFAENDDLSILTSPIVFTTTATADSGVGTYTITPSGALAAGYEITFVPGNLTVNPALLTIAANSFNRTYGDANPTFTATFTGLVAGDTTTDITGLSLTTAATTSSGVGDYAITAAGASSANYTISYEAGTLSIDPAALTVTLDDQSRDYGDANPTLTASFAGFKLADTAAVLTGLAPTTTATTTSGAGDYAVTTGTVTAANYTVTVNDGTLTVEPAAVTITADDQTRTYGAANPSLTATATGLKLGQDASVLTGLTVTTFATATAAAGTYPIAVSGATNANYTITFVPGALTVNPAPLNITANSFTRTYGAANPTLTAQVDGLVAGDIVADLGAISFTTAATATSGVGSYSITPSASSNSNYTITFTPGTLTVNPAPLTLNVADATKVYADLNPTFSATATGLVLDEMLDALGTITFSTTATQLTGIGDTAINATIAGAGFANYDVTLNPGTLTIAARPVTAFANHVTRSYGDANPTVTWGLRGDAPPGLNLTSLIDPGALTFTTAATAASNVGVYDYVVGGITNPNLAVTYEAGSITVNPAPLTIGVPNRSRTYGSENPTFTATATGLKLSDTLADVIAGGPTFATTATVASNVGSYTVTPGGTVTSGNYDVTFNAGTLTITRAPLFIAPTLSSRLYGDADPAFSITATGLLNGDTSAVVSSLNFSGSAPTAGVGSHAISILSGTAQNYTLTFGAGVLNVLPRPLTITAHDFSREYGEANPTFTSTFNGLASFDSTAVITGLAFSTPATAASSVIPGGGGYGINVTSNANRNYAITYVPGTLTVTPAPLLVNLTSITREYGETTPTPTATVSTGLKNDDTLGLLGLTYSNLALPTADVGTFAYGATASNPNYQVAFTGGTQTITPAPLTVRVSDVFRAYGDDNPDSFTVNLDGLKFAADPADLVVVNNAANFRSDAGVYPFAVQLLSGNYTLNGVSGDLTVTPRLIDVLASASRVYGDANPAAAAFTLTGDFVNGDQAADVVGFFSYGNPVAVSADVGNYDISSTARYLAPDPNYVIRSFTGTLSVDPRPLSINIADVERFYGDAGPAVTLLGDTNLVPALDALDEVLRFTGPDERTVPGNYTVEVELLNANYTFAQQGFGRVSILPRPLSITVNNAARFYGDTNPAFTATYGGLGLPSFVNPADFLRFGTAESTDARSNSGHYLISASPTGLDSSLYTIFNFTPGILSILPRPITLSIDDLTFVYPTNTDLAGQTDFSEVPFTATATNLAAGDSVTTVFPDLVFEVLSAVKTGEVAAPVQPATYTPPPVAAMVAGDGTGSGGSDGGGTAITFIPVVIEGLAVPEMNTSIPLATSTFGLPADFQLSTSGLVTTAQTEQTLERTVALTGGYLNANPNYAVTAVNTGVITMKSLALSADELSRLDPNGLDAGGDTGPLVVRGLSDYRENIGVLFGDHPTMAKDMIMDYFSMLFEADGFADDALLESIFGSGVTGMDGVNSAAIGAWLSDIDSNPAKRILLSAPLSSYVLSLQGRDASTYSLGEQRLIETLNAEMRDQRAVVAAEIEAKKVAWEQQGGSTAGTQMADLFDGDVPYATFLSDYVTDSTEDTIAKIATVVAGSGGAAAASTALAVTTSFSVVAKAIFPFARISAGARIAMGPVGAIIMVVEGSISRALVIADNAKAKVAYDRLVDPNSMPTVSNLNIAPDDTSPESAIDRVILLNSLTSMLGG